MSFPIQQGELHSFTFIVSPSDPVTSSPLLDLVLALSVSSGAEDVYVVDPHGVTLNPPSFGSNGLILVNRSTGAGDSGRILFGAYTVKLRCVQTDTYTLSVTMARRIQLLPSIPTPVGGVGVLTALLVPHSFTFVDYTVTAAGPTQMAVAIWLDREALLSAGVDPSTAILPTIYWAKDYDVPSWSPSNSSYTWTTLPSSGQPAPSLYSIVSAYDECTAPPCRYSFAVVPVMPLPVLPLLTVTPIDLRAGYDTSLDYTLVSPPADLTNITISSPLASLSSMQAHYYAFPVFASQNLVELTLSSSSPSANFTLLVCKGVDYPDVNSQQWMITQSGPSATLTITSQDPFFLGLYSRLPVAGSYQVTVFAQPGGEYQLTLSLSDRLNQSVPLLNPNATVTGSLDSADVQYFRYVVPPLPLAVDMDLVFTAYSTPLYISDRSVTPGPNSPYAENNIASSSSIDSVVNIVTVTRRSGVGLSPVYYIALSRLRAWRSTNSSYSVSVSLVPHVVFLVDTTFHSETPLLSGQIRYFELYQPPFTSVNLSFVLSVADTTRFGDLYAIVLPMETPDSYVGNRYPSPNSVNGGNYGNQYWMLGNSSFNQTGQQNATFSSSCTASYRCIWRIALYAPRPQALLNYSLSVTELSSSPLRPSTELFNRTSLDVTLTVDRVLPLSFYVPRQHQRPAERAVVSTTRLCRIGC